MLQREQHSQKGTNVRALTLLQGRAKEEQCGWHRMLEADSVGKRSAGRASADDLGRVEGPGEVRHSVTLHKTLQAVSQGHSLTLLLKWTEHMGL